MWNFTGRLLLLLAVGLANGCVGYRVGTVNPTIPADHSIQVGLFQNGTAQPGLSESVNASIRRELHRDGTFELATANDGDVLLTGNITAYRRSAVSFQPRDILAGACSTACPSGKERVLTETTLLVRSCRRKHRRTNSQIPT